MVTPKECMFNDQIAPCEFYSNRQSLFDRWRATSHINRRFNNCRLCLYQLCISGNSSHVGGPKCGCPWVGSWEQNGASKLDVEHACEKPDVWPPKFPWKWSILLGNRWILRVLHETHRCSTCFWILSLVYASMTLPFYKYEVEECTFVTFERYSKVLDFQKKILPNFHPNFPSFTNTWGSLNATHFGGIKTIEIYSNFEGFPL